MKSEWISKARGKYSTEPEVGERLRVEGEDDDAVAGDAAHLGDPGLRGPPSGGR